MKAILQIAQEILQQSNTPLSPNKMWHIALKMGLTRELNLSGKTPWASFGAAIYVDVKNENSIFEVVQKKPVLIKLKGQKFAPILTAQNMDQNTSNFQPKIHQKQRKFQMQISKNSANFQDEMSPNESKFNERDLHPLLAKFLYSSENFSAFCKTIFHETSKKSQCGVDKWLYPDIVGVSFEYANFGENTLKFISKFSKLPIKIYSFEMKKSINIAKFREVFFQAVSNSSWANEGYLVAPNIDESDTALMELMNKSSLAFGIGIISLDTQNIAQSRVLCAAKVRERLDFSAIDELGRKSRDFANFIKTATEFDYKNERRFLSEFDEILDDDTFESYLKAKNIG